MSEIFPVILFGLNLGYLSICKALPKQSHTHPKDLSNMARKYLPAGTLFELFQFYLGWCSAHEIEQKASWFGLELEQVFALLWPFAEASNMKACLTLGMLRFYGAGTQSGHWSWSSEPVQSSHNVMSVRSWRTSSLNPFSTISYALFSWAQNLVYNVIDALLFFSTDTWIAPVQWRSALGHCDCTASTSWHSIPTGVPFGPWGIFRVKSWPKPLPSLRTVLTKTLSLTMRSFGGYTWAHAPTHTYGIVHLIINNLLRTSLSMLYFNIYIYIVFL